jgi:hypothetical protein
MIFHDIYTDIPRDELDRFVASQTLGRLVTVGDDGTPHIGLYPFLRDGDRVELGRSRERRGGHRAASATWRRTTRSTRARSPRSPP